jgi:anhydro-N-acetylmuramic acid kinase
MNPEAARLNPGPELYVGLMSGTSLDGVDAALVEFCANLPRLIATHYSPFPSRLVSQLLELQTPGENELHRAALLANELAEIYHQSVRALLEKAAAKPESVRAIGCHGQTIRHNPRHGYTLQLGNPSLLAELCGISVVADFRGRDIAAGGQGAPLVPAFHDAVFRITDLHRIVLNIGGIANVTNLAPATATTGFDCGPGNMLMDAWIQTHSSLAFDENGSWAATGHAIPSLLQALMGHPFFTEPPPKSCGREEFNLSWLTPYLANEYKAEDVQATLLELTADTIARSIRRWCGKPEELVVCGGGARNTRLMRRLAEHLPDCRVFPSDRIGIGADWMEAMAFAWLARQRLLGKPGNLPEVTGARGLRELGALYPA